MSRSSQPWGVSPTHWAFYHSEAQRRSPTWAKNDFSFLLILSDHKASSPWQETLTIR